MRIDVAWGQIQGDRLAQEDTAVCLAWPTGLHLLVVADGIGGRIGGSVASEAVVETFREAFVEAVDLAVPDRLLAALGESNSDLYDRIEADPGLRGMGTTIVAACTKEYELWWVSVGDSSIWLVRGQSIRRLNSKHTVGAFLDMQVERGVLSAQQASAAPDRPHLVEAVLGEDINWVDAPSDGLSLLPHDRLLLSTDGIETCNSDELHEIASREGCGASEIVESILEHVEGKERPNQDNATIIVALIEE